ncbi:hypothetical protein M3I01_009665 [Marinomonas sp. RSW2]|uniref:Uncharacterized protein n=1 Tax=Marinomonas maritima TaxID=2940935 RepID=A0ABT5WEC6_9GAMM|nr:hypothetical protein [Marinomonas maritima]MDE8603177.1 hypothetical protein [Marinomonas maritima]
MNNCPQSNQKISEHVMTLITFLTLVPLVYFIPDFLKPFLPYNKWINVIASVGTIVPIVSYVVMPIANLILLRNKKSD